MKGLAGKTARELEKALDRVFSEYIRLRDSDEHGYCRCITCGGIYHWKDCDCGHFISRGKKAVRFEETNSHSQCRKCNRFRSGMWLEYEAAVNETHGPEEAERLKRLAKLGGSLDAFQMELKISEYREKVKVLKKGKL